jgi:mono/diheme cytochrome c family protein
MPKSIHLALLLVAALALLALAAACAPAAAPTAVPPTPAPPTALPPPPTATTALTTVPPTAPPPAPTTAATTALTTAAVGAEVTGQQLFALACASCHGPSAQGSTFTRKGQTIKVPTLGWADLSKMYSTKPDRGSVEQQLVLAITQGEDEEGDSFNAMMPRWSPLSQNQVTSLIDYLKNAGTAPAATPALSGAATQLMGQQLFQTSCATCHGANAEGNKFTRKGQTVSVPSLKWSDLAETYSTDPSRGSVEQQVALAITKGQDESGEALNAMMPHWTLLSQAQVDSLVAFLKTTGQ